MTVRYLRRLIKDFQTYIFFTVFQAFIILLIWLFRPNLLSATIFIFLALNILFLWAASKVGYYRIKTNLMILVRMNTVLHVQDYTNFHKCTEFCGEEEGHIRYHEASKQYFLNAEAAAQNTNQDINDIIRQLVTNTPDDLPDAFHRVSIKEALPIWVSDYLIPRLFVIAIGIVITTFFVILGIKWVGILE